RQDDPRYIRTSGTSEEMFFSLIRFTEDVLASVQRFDAAFELRPALFGQDDTMTAGKLHLRDVLFGSSRLNFEIDAIHFDEPVLFSPDSAYNVHLLDRQPYCANAWSLLIDRTPAGLKIIALESGTLVSARPLDRSCPARSRF
ncbi:MAG: hypothetical protein ACREMY_34210, partial [bacterium]